MAYFEVENIKKSFDKTEVLKGVGFTMEKGEVLSVIGSSGSGKTTLLRCIDFLERADEGKITLDGEVLFDAGNENEGAGIIAEDPLFRRADLRSRPRTHGRGPQGDRGTARK